jgi:hypothetical protein
MCVRPAPVEPTTLRLLAGTHMSDAYCLTVDDKSIDATIAAQRVFSSMPWWVRALVALRDRLVAPFGLKTSRPNHPAAPRRIGVFPVIAEAADRVLLGLDDKHLDFRIVVDVMPVGTGRWQITTTTLVRTHNLLGRAYLAAVLPFHRVIVPAMLAHAASGPSRAGPLRWRKSEPFPEGGQQVSASEERSG